MTGTTDSPAATLGLPTPPAPSSYDVVVIGSTITICDDYTNLIDCETRGVNDVELNVVRNITPAQAVRLAQQLVMAAVSMLDPADVSARERQFVASVLWASRAPFHDKPEPAEPKPPHELPVPRFPITSAAAGNARPWSRALSMRSRFRIPRRPRLRGVRGTSTANAASSSSRRPSASARRAVVLCDRLRSISTFTAFESVEEASRFAQRRPCPGRGCGLVHILGAWADDGSFTVEIHDDHRRHLDRAAAIAAAYPRKRVGARARVLANTGSFQHAPTRGGSRRWTFTKPQPSRGRSPTAPSTQAITGSRLALEAASKAASDRILNAALGLGSGPVDDMPSLEPGVSGRRL